MHGRMFTGGQQPTRKDDSLKILKFLSIQTYPNQILSTFKPVRAWKLVEDFDWQAYLSS